MLVLQVQAARPRDGVLPVRPAAGLGVDLLGEGNAGSDCDLQHVFFFLGTWASVHILATYFLSLLNRNSGISGQGTGTKGKVCASWVFTLLY